ncbi:MAG: HlyD family efflux transporter periplasmic adaptor subunit [Butyrivibrio sp.]|nr:HlyD family efflux transporter periplasmic adaptor subunit [Butyrivibrio sp.]
MNNEIETVVEEKSKKRDRKDVIKNVAIVFLSVMLLLTFFSNTIMNYSLPQVATVQVERGKISKQIRGTGDISAEDPYNVTLKETRKISGVSVKEGAHVEKDDVIFLLEDTESPELSEAKDKLDTLQLTFDQKLFSGKVPDNVITNVRNGKSSTYDAYQKKVKEVTDRYDAALAADNEAEAQLNYITQKAAYEKAGTDYNAVTPGYVRSQAEADKAEAEARGDEERVKDLNAMIQESQKDEAQLGIYGQQIGASNEQKVATATEAKNKTAQELKTAETEKEKMLEGLGIEIELFMLKDQIADQKKKIAKLEENSVGASIKAPVAGTISSITKVAGETASPDETIAVIQVDGKDMTLEFSVTTAEAKKLKVGDVAEPTDKWQFKEEFRAILKSVKNDKTDPSGKKVLTFKVNSTEVTPGQSVSVSIGEKPKEYDMVVPRNAIKGSGNDRHVLVVKQKSSPLGNRYIATKVPVEVIEEDDNNAAINAVIEDYESVITTASKPVKAGEQVRLQD